MTPFLIIGGLALAFALAGYYLGEHPGGRSGDERLAGQFLSGCCWIAAAAFGFMFVIGGIVRVFQR